MGVIALVLSASYMIGFLFGEIWDRGDQLLGKIRGLKATWTSWREQEQEQEQEQEKQKEEPEQKQCQEPAKNEAEKDRRKGKKREYELGVFNWCLDELHRTKHIIEKVLTRLDHHADGKCETTMDRVPALAPVRDILRIQGETEVSLLLTKLRSEKRLCEVLVLGFASLALLQVYLPGSMVTWEKPCVAIFLFVGSLTCLGKSRSLKRFSLSLAFNSLLGLKTTNQANRSSQAPLPGSAAESA